MARLRKEAGIALSGSALLGGAAQCGNGDDASCEGREAGKEMAVDVPQEELEEEDPGDAEDDGNGVPDDGDPSAADAADGWEDEEWEEIYACPLEVRFTQEKIHPFFYRRGPIVNVVPKIRPVLRSKDADGDSSGRGEEVQLLPPFSSIHCLRKGDELWSLDNRRLYALQLAAMDQWPRRCSTHMLCRDKLPRHKFKSQYRKFNTTSEGRAIDVCARYQQFDTWNWFDRAVEIEWYTLSRRFGALLWVFEVAPVLGALLYRTGLLGFASRVPLIVGFVLAFFADYLRQKVPFFERKVCEHHVRAVIDGEVMQISPLLCRLWPGSEEEEENSETSAPQLAAMTGLTLVLALPYVIGTANEKLRSSFLSCWLGVACVLVMQLGGLILRTGTRVAQPLSPKHRGT
mmetsp:Transcript_94733/g.210617  ORF Transcript_94733/g.210617 Transcript_94733/m.210617 type:complete len:402 (+) Transcript_94733:195-1400(+)